MSATFFIMGLGVLVILVHKRRAEVLDRDEEALLMRVPLECSVSSANNRILFGYVALYFATQIPV